MKDLDDLFIKTQLELNSCLDYVQKSSLEMQSFSDKDYIAEAFNVKFGYVFHQGITFNDTPYMSSLGFVSFNSGIIH